MCPLRDARLAECIELSILLTEVAMHESAYSRSDPRSESIWMNRTDFNTQIPTSGAVQMDKP